MNFYPFHIGDYISHTSHLSDAEDLAYRRMIDLYYQTQQPFNDSSTVARRVRTSVEIVEVILHEFFVLEDDGWHNKRADEEIAKYENRLEQASRAGKASAERRLNARSTSVQLTKNHEPRTKNHEPINKNIEIPAWLNREAWDSFVEFRKKIKKPMTDKAKLLAISQLNKLNEQCNNPVDVINQSILNGWSGLFALKQDKAKLRPTMSFDDIEYGESGLIK